MGPFLLLLAPPFLAFLGSAVAAWRVGARTIVPTILLGWILCSLLIDVVARGPETEAMPSMYLLSFALYAGPFLLLGLGLRDGVVDGDLSLGTAILAALLSTVNIVIFGCLLFEAGCRLALWQCGCAEALAALLTAGVPAPKV